MSLKYLHTMVRVCNLEQSLDFYVKKLGLVEVRRKEVESGRFTLVFLAPPGQMDAQIELTWNWDSGSLGEGRNFGHLAFQTEDIYVLCQKLLDAGVTLNRPPRDGYMAFVRSPDNISIEILQRKKPLEPCEPWLSMPNVGKW